jgi:two-component system nitrate/nitrite response regulator NarL
LLGGTDAVTVVGSSATYSEALAAVGVLAPAVVLLDMTMADSLEIARALRTTAPTVGIVGFAADPSEVEQLLCVEAGVTGFVPRGCDVCALLEALTNVARGVAVCSPRLVATTFRRLAAFSCGEAGAAPQPLSVREQQIVELIDQGCSNKEIARRLHIGVPTAKNHVHHILEKLQVLCRSEAAASVREAARRRPSLASPLGNQLMSTALLASRSAR